jgi:hypothetical protein
MLFDPGAESFVPVEGAIGFYVNQNTGTFSLAVFFPDGSYCEVMSGVDFQPYID